MTVVEGGLRDRLVFESFHTMVKTALTDLGWFEPGRKHAPVVFRTTAVPEGEQIPANTVAVSSEDLDDSPGEIGSTLTEDRTVVWVDFYAESDALGRHLIGDVRDVLRGKMPSIGRTDPSFVVLDFTVVAPHPELFLVGIEDVAVERSHSPTAQRHWFAVTCSLVEDRP